MKAWVHPILDHLGIDPSALLGKGSEAHVFALDDARVVRVADPRTPRAYLERLAAFQATLDRAAVPFALPRILELGAHAGQLYTIEDRIPGEGMMDAVDRLTGGARADAIAGFTRAALALRDVGVASTAFHRPLDAAGATFPTSSALLVALVDRARTRAKPSLTEDIPGWERAQARWRAEIGAVDAHVTPSLVHGDYFLGNAMCDPDGHVTGVVDFSNLTMIGDWRLDAVSTLLFLDQLPSFTPDDLAPAREVLAPLMDDAFAQAYRLYRGFYALYYAPFAAPDDPALYQWCRDVLAEPEWTRK
jgi:aminoglycoside phosphotransferase (APT) family kinase protein